MSDIENMKDVVLVFGSVLCTWIGPIYFATLAQIAFNRSSKSVSMTDVVPVCFTIGVGMIVWSLT